MIGRSGAEARVSTSPRDAATIAAFLRTRVYRPESSVWLEDYQALLRWRAENEITGLYAVPYDVETDVGVTKGFPLGRWVHQQRKALQAGELEPRRKGCWTPRRPGWCGSRARKPGRASSPRCGRTGGLRGTLLRVRTRCGARAGRWCRSRSTWPPSAGRAALEKDAERAAERAKQLAAIAPNWNCPWPLHRQRHYRVLADLVDTDGNLPDIAPCMTFDGDDIGRWLERQKQPGTWAQLSPERQERLTRLGVMPLEPPSPAPAAKRAARAPARHSRPSSAP